MNEGKSDNKNQYYILMLLLLRMQTVLLLQHNAIRLLLHSVREYYVFHSLSFILKCRHNILFNIGIKSIYKTLTAIVGLFFRIFHLSSFVDRKSMPFQLYLCIKGLFLDILSEYFLISF